MPGEKDTWYSDVLNIWKDGILCTNCNMKYQTTSLDQLRKTFSYGGYYKVSTSDGKMNLLVLNTMYWTKSAWKPKNYFVNRANTQMKWLEGQLNIARKTKKKVIISSHISLGMDIYVHISTWMSNFTDLYINLVVNEFNDVVAGQIFSHFHRDSFRLLSDKKKDSSHRKFSYVLLMPSVSPSYRNYPAFRVVNLDPSLQAITDYEQYYLNIDIKNPVWQLDYKFSTRYPPTGDDDKVINGKRIKHLSDNLISERDYSFFNSFISSRQVRHKPDSYSRSLFYCAITCIRKKEFDACRKKYPEDNFDK
ncbi:acid sphingomyelinase-like phosphodiesterase 3a [Dendronephthya gigantea]|uniref:acid sphingomyelinase-like phosphodiesterase 3a n=1 Tax=Dendronephthya gigantea TaxID=151771 RepID=UPI00106B6D2D|nr:acid sphingomyelinase-like phosphodiesterase 3a [Dendronephthya gigantea]